MGGIYGHPWFNFDGGSLIYWKGGAFTPTEAAAVAAVYAFLIATFVYRDMGRWRAATGLRPIRCCSARWP